MFLSRYRARLKKIWQLLGPGFITGASDDDPSGIATYSQAGSSLGLATLWTAFFTFPLMANIQEMCARIGMVTQGGLGKVMRRRYPRALLAVLMLLSVPAIILNIAADIAAIGATAHMVYPGLPPLAYTLLFVGAETAFLVFFSYRRIAGVMKWLCLVLLAYLLIPFLVGFDGKAVLKASFVPDIRFDKSFIAMLVALLGTTISPYLFFWQASMESEERAAKPQALTREMIGDMRLDVYLGMFLSNLVMYFIILTTGTVLYNAGLKEITTVEDAARALQPLAGQQAFLLFAVGVIGTGLLAIPVLAGSVSYLVAETLGWRMGLDQNWHKAKSFYLVLVLCIALGQGLNFFNIDPIQALIFTAIVYGVTAPPMIAVILHICNSREVMGEYTNGRIANMLGIITLVVMTLAAGLLLYVSF